MTTIDSRPTKVDLDIDQGDDYALVITVNDSTLQGLLTTADAGAGSAELVAAIVNRAGTSVQAFAVDWTSPTLTLSLTQANVDGLDTGTDRYRWYLDVNDGTGAAGRIWFAGDVTAHAIGEPAPASSSASAFTVNAGGVSADLIVSVQAGAATAATQALIAAATSQLDVIVLTADQLSAVFGGAFSSYDPDVVDGWPGWLLQDSGNPAVGALVHSSRFSGWSTYDLDLLWVNTTANSGNVRLRTNAANTEAKSDGETLGSASFTVGTADYAAPGQNVLEVTRVVSAQTAPTDTLAPVTVQRNSNSANDTLTGNIAVLALVLTKAS